MSTFTIQTMVGEGEWVPAQIPLVTYDSMGKAFNALEHSLEEQHGGTVTRVLYKGDTITVFGRANGYDMCWQIVPAVGTLKLGGARK